MAPLMIEFPHDALGQEPQVENIKDATVSCTIVCLLLRMTHSAI